MSRTNQTAAGNADQRRRRSPRRRFLLINGLILLVLLGGVEAALRLHEYWLRPRWLGGSIPPVQQYHRGRLPDGREVYYSRGADLSRNKLTIDFKRDYPPNTHFNLYSVEPAIFLVDKPPGVKRIFLVGGSPIWGAPGNDQMNLSYHLRRVLTRRDPQGQYEIINAARHLIGMAGTLAVVAEVSQFSPDLLVLHPGSIFPDLEVKEVQPTDLTQPPWRLWLRRWLHYSYLLGAIEDLWQSGSVSSEKTMLLAGINQPDQYNQQTVNMVLNHRRMTIEALLMRFEAFAPFLRTHRIPLVLLSVPSNLADALPPASAHFQALSETKLQEFKRHYLAGRKYYQDGDCPAALPELRAAYAISPSYADNAFILGRCLLAAGDVAGANGMFFAARDNDAIGERSGSELALLLREWCRKNGVPMFDLEAYMLAHSPTGTLGRELFRSVDHPTAEGSKLMALAVADLMSQMGLIPSSP